MENFWGNFKIDDIVTPKEILEEQAKYLLKVTKNYVYAVVQCEQKELIKNSFDNIYKDFNYTFNIRSKFITTYSYRIFSIHHDIELYPLQIKINNISKECSDMLEKENLGDPINMFRKENSIIKIKDENEFKKALKIILSSDKVHKVVSSLVSLSKQKF